MLGIIRKRKPYIHSHWYVPLLDTQSDPEKFYQAVEEELVARKVPGLSVERIDFNEGGILDANRAYLRLQRERVVLDLCSAPFGTSWWFSCRTAELPRVLYVWEILLVLAGLAGFFALYWQIFGLIIGAIVFCSSLVFLILVFLTARSWAALDEFLIYLPVVGALYESCVRKETYHRQDQWLMYGTIVNTLVRGKVSEFCKAAGEENPQFITTTARQIMSPRELEKYGYARSRADRE